MKDIVKEAKENSKEIEGFTFSRMATIATTDNNMW